MIEARAAFAAEVAAVDPAKLVALDESFATTAMARTHGRAPPGERVAGSTPRGHWKVTTVLGAIRSDGLCAAMTVDAAADGDVFLAFVGQVLCPALRPGDVVLMDNLAPHKLTTVRELVEAAGARVLYLPPYSPDLNPIEKMWSKVKQFLRSAAARTQQALEEAIATALAAVSAADCLGWFGSCGYPVH